MPRPKKHKCLQFNPHVDYFKPRGIPLTDLGEVVLLSEELEAVKLYFVDNLDQIHGAEKICVSQPTFARIIDSACKKIADALINGKAIRIEKNDN